MAKKPQLPAHANAAVLAYNRVVDQYRKESDRAAAILAASHLDVLLLWVLQAYLVPGKSTDELFDGSGALATFSARIKTVYAMGLMQESAMRDFDLVRKLRNHFAHHPDEVSFAAEPAAGFCRAFANVSWPGLPEDHRDKHLPPREQFLSTVATLSAWADYTLDRITSGEVPRRKAPPESDRFEPW